MTQYLVYKMQFFNVIVSENACVYTVPALPSLGKANGNSEGEEFRGTISKGNSCILMQSLVSEKFH